MSIDVRASPHTRRSRHRVITLAVLVLFYAVFLYSGVWSIVDPSGTRAATEGFGFPGYFVYPQAIAKLVGLAVILWGGSRLLTGLAFAGFFYDVTLALSAHIAQRDVGNGALAAVGLGLTVGAFFAERQLRGRSSPAAG